MLTKQQCINYVLNHVCNDTGLSLKAKTVEVKKVLEWAVCLGFEEGKNQGRAEKHVDDVFTQSLIQPENDRLWQEELEAIMKNYENISCNTPETAQVKLLGLIAEMILYRRNGG